MKTWIKALFAVILISGVAGGGTYYFVNKKANTDKNNLQSQIDNLNTKLAATTTSLAAAQAAKTLADETADWSSYTSSIVNLKFKYPAGVTYQESDLSAKSDKSGAKFTGHQDLFSLKSGTQSLPFSATTTDFTSVDVIPHDLLLNGTLESTASLKISLFDKATQIATEVSPGMFHVTGYSNMECSFGVNSYLFVLPPAGSGLKYIDFHLGQSEKSDYPTNPEAVSSDPNNVTCQPTDGDIKKIISSVDQKKSVLDNLSLAVKIAKTFSVK